MAAFWSMIESWLVVVVVVAAVVEVLMMDVLVEHRNVESVRPTQTCG